MEEIKQTLVSHSEKITQLEDSTEKVLNKFDTLVDSMNELTVTIAVSNEKHDNYQQEAKEYRKTISELTKIVNLNTRDIAEMKPTVSSVRGLMWKVIGALMLGMGGSSFLAAALIKSGG